MLYGLCRFRLSSNRIWCSDTSSTRDWRLHWLYIVLIGVSHYWLYQVIYLQKKRILFHDIWSPRFVCLSLSFSLSLAWCRRPFRTLLNVVRVLQYMYTPYYRANRYSIRIRTWNSKLNRKFCCLVSFIKWIDMYRK